MIMFEGHKRLGPQLPICTCLGECHSLFSEEHFDPSWTEVTEMVYPSMLSWLRQYSLDNVKNVFGFITC